MHVLATFVADLPEDLVAFLNGHVLQCTVLVRVLAWAVQSTEFYRTNFPRCIEGTPRVRASSRTRPRPPSGDPSAGLGS